MKTKFKDRAICEKCGIIMWNVKRSYATICYDCLLIDKEGIR